MKIKFLVTVDVETYFANGKLLPFDINIYGKSKGEEYGIPRIMEICNRYNVKGTFFVDVYEHYKFGIGAYKEICQKISNSGHSVQLHAHPNFIPAHSSGFMKSYDFQTQKEIISEGRGLIRDWISKSPIVFRGGAYGVNLDTIQALEENGFSTDSSYFVAQKNCALSSELRNSYNNRLFMINNILEVPVTVYNLINLFFWKKKSKLDLNACSKIELFRAIKEMMRLNTKNQPLVIVLFLHSFSFIRWNKSFTNFSIDYKTLENFDSVLRFITKSYSEKAEFITIDEFDKNFINDIKNRALDDFVPTLNIPYLIPRYIKRLNLGPCSKDTRQ